MDSCELDGTGMSEHHDDCECEDCIEQIREGYRRAAFSLLEKDIDREGNRSPKIKREALLYLAEALTALAGQQEALA